MFAIRNGNCGLLSLIDCEGVTFTSFIENAIIFDDPMGADELIIFLDYYLDGACSLSVYELTDDDKKIIEGR